MIEGSLEVKLPTISNIDRWKAEMGRVREEKRRRQKIKKEKVSEERRSRCAKRYDSRETLCVSNDLWLRRVGSLKRRVRSHVVRWEMKSCTTLWREDARSTFPSQNAQNTPCSDHFWKLRCRKSARCCYAKHISKSKCTQSTTCSRHFWTLKRRFGWQAQGIAHLVKGEQNVRVFCSISKNDGRRGTFEEDLKDA